MRLDKTTLDQWEVQSLKGQDEVNSGSKRQATKLEEAKTEHQAQAKKWC